MKINLNKKFIIAIHFLLLMIISLLMIVYPIYISKYIDNIDNNLLSIDENTRKNIFKEFQKNKRTYLLIDQEDKKEYEFYNKIYI